LRRDNPVSKSSLRREIKKHLAGLSPGEFRVQGEAAAALLRESPLWTRYGTVFLFLSLPDEIDTRPLVETALEAGKRVFAPRVKPAGELEFYRVFPREGSGPRDFLEPGPFGIPEPPPVEPPGPADFPALILVPGLAFDTRGRRLGRGGGYYDRFLAAHTGVPGGGCPEDAAQKPADPCRIIGLCMPFQLVQEVPVEQWDRGVDGVCTGEAFFRIPRS
jgi:5-formyltetrahydrofolate cyclo-ligase